ncbi:MAG: acyl-CoA thioesterase [Acidobacteria bacterium]|nr:acyl-CoA thioesterase [Acidobacteriota bacterium]
MPEVRVQTYWSDCDPAGIVYFGNFFHLFEQAEEQLYILAATTRQALLETHSVWMPRVEVHVTFVAPIRVGRAIRIRIDPHFKGEKTVRFECEVIDDETGARLAGGYMTAVCVDRATFKARPIPDDIRRVLAGRSD